MDKEYITKPEEQLWHHLSADKVLALLSAKPEGLSREEAQKRLAKYGRNELPSKKPTGSLVILVRQFSGLLIGILVAAGLITFLLGEYIDALVILLAVVVNVILGFAQERRAEKALSELRRVISYQARVWRQGQLQTIPTSEAVPGDLLILGAGDRVPADARLITTHGLEVNEAVLTGESMPVIKGAKELAEGTILAERTNIVYLGTDIVSGTAQALVVATGLETEFGKITKAVAQAKLEETPLQIKLARLGRGISLVVAIICLVIFSFGVILGFSPMQMFTTAVAIAVSAVPEGLVVAVTAILALGMRRILARQGLVRKLLAAETLGSTTVICTDKTGTLTSGQMQVAVVWTLDEEASSLSEKLQDGSSAVNLLKVGVLASDAYIENPQDELEAWKVAGNPTEQALIMAAVQAGIPVEDLRKNRERLDELPFDAVRKFMITLHHERAGKSWLFLKGSPESVLERCQFYHSLNNQSHLSKPTREKILRQVDNFSSQGLRLLAFAQRELPKPIKEISKVEDLNQGFIFLGLVGIKDPLRPEVKESLKQAQAAGIKVVVITGDHKLTAQAIARELDLPAGEENILEGKELARWSDQVLQKKINEISIFARTTPHDKPRIVDAWQARGEVVAMTGDGVNDAPALRSANIGIALGSGSDVAKETADLVLLDDNFKTIVSAIEEGRTIYQNIRKMVLYLLSDSFSETVVILGSFLLASIWQEALPLPILATQILWINLVTDSLPALAFTVEPPSPEAMIEPPIKPKASILDAKRLWLIGTMGSFRGLLALGLFLAFWQSGAEIAHARTLVFTLLVISSLFYAVNCKQMRYSWWHKRTWNNPFLIMALMLALLLQLAVIYVPFLQNALHTAPLGLLDWLIILLLAGILSLTVEVFKPLFAKIFPR